MWVGNGWRRMEKESGVKRQWDGRERRGMEKTEKVYRKFRDRTEEK